LGGGMGEQGWLQAHAQLACIFYFIDKVAFAGDLSVQFRQNIIINLFK